MRFRIDAETVALPLFIEDPNGSSSCANDRQEDTEFSGRHGFALQISSMICKELKGELRISTVPSSNREVGVTYVATFPVS